MSIVQDFTAARVNMVENQVRTNDVTDLPIQDAMRVVARERFCPLGKQYLAYAEAAVEYAPGFFLLEPRDVSKLLQAVYPEPHERALAIVAPYAAALMADMGLEVTLLMPTAETAEAVARGLEGGSVRVIVGDLHAPAGGPFDVLVTEQAVPDAPKAWQDLVGVGGRLGLVERNGPVGKARVYLRGEDGLLGRREVFDSAARMLPGFERRPQFTF
jgi:protein-L-isoaspartate(D-aspartate) O-methyltransferase